MRSNDWIWKNKSKLCAVSKALEINLNFPLAPSSWVDLTGVFPFIAGAPEAAAFDRATGVPHGAVEVRWDESSSADGAAGSCAAECRRTSRTTSTWPTSARPTSRHAPWTPRTSRAPRPRTSRAPRPRTSRAPRPRISPLAPSHGSPPCPSDRSACNLIFWFCVWGLLLGCSFLYKTFILGCILRACTHRKTAWALLWSLTQLFLISSFSCSRLRFTTVMLHDLTDLDIKCGLLMRATSAPLVWNVAQWSFYLYYWLFVSLEAEMETKIWLIA